MFNKEFSFLEKLNWNFSYVILISSSEKQNQEWLYSDRYGDCCCSTTFSSRCNKSNVSCPCEWNIKKRSFSHLLKTCFPNGKKGGYCTFSSEEGMGRSHMPEVHIQISAKSKVLIGCRLRLTRDSN